MYKDFSFRYIIIITKYLFLQLYIYVYIYVLLNNSKIKSKIQNLLTKYKKLFFSV